MCCLAPILPGPVLLVLPRRMQVGWQLLVANVGDSLAYLDTGAEVVQISGNHRVEGNAEEQERIKAVGGEWPCCGPCCGP